MHYHFFGSAFTIMAFNNDISVTDVFDKLYGQVTGTKADGVNELEVCYCIGLGLGIILFFNHVGRKKITPDPTPIQIEMRKYEKMWIPHLLKMQAEEVTA